MQLLFKKLGYFATNIGCYVTNFQKKLSTITNFLIPKNFVHK